MRMAGQAGEILQQMQIDNDNRLYCMKVENRHKAECAKYLFEGMGSGNQGGDQPKPDTPKPEKPTEGNKVPANPKAVK
jgi:hypothetical protein